MTKMCLFTKRLLAGAVVLLGVLTASATTWKYEKTPTSGTAKRLVSDDGWEFEVTLSQKKTNYEGEEFSGAHIGNTKVVGTGDVLDFSTATEALGGQDIISMKNTFYADATGRAQIREVTLPDTLVYIDDGTFRDCAKLEKVTPFLPSGVYWIGARAFAGTSKLKGRLEIGVRGNKVGFSDTGNTFYPCGVEEVILGDAVASLPSQAFRECTALTNLVLGTGLTSIGGAAFRGCSGIETVTPFLPDGVTYIGNYAFGGCAKIGGVLTIGKSGAAVMIESSNSANHFNGIKGVTKIVLGSGVTVIPNNCFGAMTSVTEVEFLGDYFDLTTKAFGANIAGQWGNLQARLLLPFGNDTWKALYEDPAKVGACSSAELETYHGRYGADIADPKGITLKSVNAYAVLYVAVKEREVSDKKPLQISGLLNGQKFEVRPDLVEPTYGEIEDVKTSITCSAPEFADQGNTRYRCVGYALSEYDDEKGWTNPVTNDVRSVDYSPSDTTYRQIAWLWEAAGYKLEVVYPEACGSVQKSATWQDDFYAAGSAPTLTAVPAEGSVFARWFGDVDEAICSNAVIQVTMDKVKKLVPYFRSDWVIVGSNMTDGYWTIPVSGGSSARTLSTPTAWPAVAAELDLRKPIASGDTITKISDNFLYDQVNHARIVRLPYTVTSIGSNAFRGQSTLVTVDPLVPASVTYIGTRAFSSCDNLASPVEIGHAKNHPGVSWHEAGYVFECDYALRTAVLGVGVKNVIKGLFNQCGGIKEITMLSDELQSVGDGAFRVLNQLQPSVLRFASYPSSWGLAPCQNWTDLRTQIYLPKGDPDWEAWMADPLAMTPWTNLSLSTQAEYTNRFPNAKLPRGLSVKADNVAYGLIFHKEWILTWNPKPTGMKLIFR